MDALLPIQRQARAYEAAVNSNNAGPLYRLYEVQNGNHIENYKQLNFSKLEFIQPHAQHSFDLLVDHVERGASLPPSQCIASWISSRCHAASASTYAVPRSTTDEPVE